MSFDANGDRPGYSGKEKKSNHACTCTSTELPYSLKFSRVRYFAVLPNSDQKQIFTGKIFVVKVPAMHCIHYELEISWEKIFAAIF